MVCLDLERRHVRAGAGALQWPWYVRDVQTGYSDGPGWPEKHGPWRGSGQPAARKQERGGSRGGGADSDGDGSTLHRRRGDGEAAWHEGSRGVARSEVGSAGDGAARRKDPSRGGWRGVVEEAEAWPRHRVRRAGRSDGARSSAAWGGRGGGARGRVDGAPRPEGRREQAVGGRSPIGSRC